MSTFKIKQDCKNDDNYDTVYEKIETIEQSNHILETKVDQIIKALSQKGQQQQILEQQQQILKQQKIKKQDKITEIPVMGGAIPREEDESIKLE